MTVHKVVSVFDRASELFGQPVFVVALGVAMRSFSDEVNRKGSALNDHPSDFELFHVGEFDDLKGRLSSFDVPVRISRAVEVFVRSEE